jgi:hypothetical protein
VRQHPHYLKHVIHGNRIKEKTAAQLMQDVRSEGAPADLPQAERTEQISVLDVSGDWLLFRVVVLGAVPKSVILVGLHFRDVSQANVSPVRLRWS